MHGPQWYRVEHHADDQIRALGRIANVFAHPSTLTPFLSRLLQLGIRQGELVLIEEATGQTVARCVVRPPRKRAWRPHDRHSEPDR